MIRIEKDRILYIETENPDESQEIYPADIPAYLGDTVEVGEFVTFYRVFDLIVENKELFNTIFAKDLGESMIDHYLEEYHQPVTHNSDSYDLEVHIICHAHHYAGYRDFDYYVSFHGMGILGDDSEPGKPYPISLSFIPLNELKHKYIRINNTVQIDTFSEEGHVSRSDIYEGEVKLYDFFAAILNEISFFGDPENRNEVSEDIKENAAAVDRGEESFITLEEIQAQWEEERKEIEEEEERLRLEEVKEKVSSGYITHFIESTYQEVREKLELLEKDLVSLERYEDARLVREKLERLNNEGEA